MSDPRVWTFFYGSYMNRRVLAEVGLALEGFEAARLPGYDIRIAPRANLVPSAERCVCGVLARATHQELSRLYAHARDTLGETYLPEPVLAETLEGTWRPALCYIAPSMRSRPAEADYVDRIVSAAREFGFPDWYVARLEGFRR